MTVVTVGIITLCPTNKFKKKILKKKKINAYCHAQNKQTKILSSSIDSFNFHDCDY